MKPETINQWIDNLSQKLHKPDAPQATLWDRICCRAERQFGVPRTTVENQQNVVAFVQDKAKAAGINANDLDSIAKAIQDGTIHID